MSMTSIGKPSSRKLGGERHGHDVPSVTLQVDRLDDGKLGIRAKGLPGWGLVVANQTQLAIAVAQAFTEAEIAAHSRWRGEGYDRDVHPPARRSGPARPRRGASRPDVYDVSEWQLLENGNWRSPSGMQFRRDTTMGQRITRKRMERGLPH